MRRISGALYQEVPQITDCIFVEIDESGNIMESSVTVTERDGISIVAEGWLKT